MAYNSTHTGATIDSAITKVAAAAGALVDDSAVQTLTNKAFNGTLGATTPASIDATDIEISTSGASNGSKAIVINTSGTNFESDAGIIQGTHAASGALTGGYWLKFKAGGSEKFTIKGNGDTNIAGALSKGSGSFKIEHPLESKKDTHNLVHSFLEGPQADLIYRGRVDLVNGVNSVNIDTASGMTDGTFVLLCRDVQSFTTNESGFTPVRSMVSGNILTIEAEDTYSNDSISWMVVAERKDQHMYETNWTDADGKVIVEPELT